MGLNSKHGALHANKVQSSNKLATCWEGDLSISGKCQAWLAMEEHDDMDSVSVGDSHFSYSTNTESESSSNKSCSSSSSIKTVSC